MTKIKILAFLLVFAAAVNAQKADTEVKKFKIPVPKSEYFNAIKKYNIVIQSNNRWDKSREYLPNETFQKNITIDRYKNDKQIDSINPDLKILVGLSQIKYIINSMGQPNVSGDLSYLILGKNNEIIAMNSVSKSMPLDRVKGRSQETEMANALCLQAYGVLDELLITTNEVELTFNYGVFEKCEAVPKLVDFNTKTQELLTKLQALTFEDVYLDEMQNFYKGYIGKQFGKIKEKDLNKVIYLNLSLIEIFKLNLPKANEYLAVAKEAAGFLSMWPDNAKKNLQRLEFVNQTNFGHKIETITSRSAYFVTLKGTAYYKKKVFTGTFEFTRFKPASTGSSGMMSLDSYSPTITIYESADAKGFDWPNGNQFNVKTEDGKEIFFKKYKGEAIMVVKNADGTFKPYESISDDVYTSPDDEKLELKKA
ncbi:hypothetical protein GKZ90_0000820 [Flavobacterium sp. MC2016-06]|uniref:hypothetical protein n=1 Tax=Flavobacterium sp. MC2016-06 TaxID=2676308 RepID=UPI0012BADC61|nr:hypothetical protein [Flavobacterium sp. MC2016-06]MBU3859469.1 hypothetical protein [Flavobacterium sp. MC2016-06]